MKPKDPIIRIARRGDEPGLHEAHMRSIREVCSAKHSEEEIRGWGNRPLGDRWIEPIKTGLVWAVELDGQIKGHGYLKIFERDGEVRAYIGGLYLTPEVIGLGVGRKLVDLMIEKASLAGAKAITLNSSLTGHEFYKRMGFEDTGPMQTEEIGGSHVRGYPMMQKLNSARQS